MALSAPWLADCLIAALQIYLPPHTETQPIDSPFEFSNDNSNLFVLVKSGPNHNICLLEWQLSQSGKVIIAEVTDGEIQVKATFRTSDLDSESSSTGNVDQLVIGTILQTSEVEFRLAGCFEPSRFTLDLKKFRVLDGVSKVIATNLPTIHNHKLAKQYLHEWKQQEETWMMDSHPSSPREIRSQIEDGSEKSCKSDGRDQSPWSVSQAQFATQLPLRESPKQPRFSIPQKPPQDSSHSGYNHDASGLDLRKESGQAVTQLLRSAPQLVASLLRENEVESTSFELSQQQLIAPSSNRPTQQNKKFTQQLLTDSVSSVLHRGMQLSSPPEYMPQALVQLLRGLREECQNGRHVPRRLQIIPKDQVKLLESDDSWQPPLVGHVQRVGTVPLDVLNRMTNEADSCASQAESNTETSNPVPKNIHFEANKEVEERNLKERSSNSSDDDSDSSEAIEWSSSPPRLRRPLDSPPPDPYHQQNINIQQEEEPSKQICKDSKLLQHPREASVLHNSSQKQSNNTTYNKNSASGLQDINRLPFVQAEVPEDIVPTLVASTSPFRSKSIPASVQKTVQVKRTPFLVKEAQLQDVIPESSSNFVPGTFDEQRIIPKNKILKKMVNRVSIADEKSKSSKSATFDVDFKHMNHRINAAGTRQQCDIVTSTPSTAQMHNDDSNSPKMIRGRKRELDNGQTKSPKRGRTNEVKRNHSSAEHSDYRAIDEERAQYRRRYLSKISRKGDLIEPVTSSPAPNIEIKSKSSQASIHLNDSPGTSSSARLRERAETSDTHFSVDHSCKPPIHTGDVHNSTSVTSVTNDWSTATLYTRFKATYPGYGGKRQHFDAACRLLRTLKLQGKATHPSLWDDFIFRHHHDYRDHLLETMETSGNALSYERFYEERVEQPTHLQRVVKPPDINSLQVDLMSTSRASLAAGINSVRTENSHNAQASALNTSATGEGFISKNLPTKLFTNPSVSVEQPTSTMHQEASQIDLKVQEAGKDLPQASNHSQESRLSVKLWLEKASGAESPILGTPQAGLPQSVDGPIPDMTLDAVDGPLPSSVATKQRRRTLPWNRTKTHKESELTHRPTSTTVVQSISSPASKPLSTNRPRGAIGVESRERQVVTSPPAPRTYQDERRASDATPETAFQRFVKFYNDIPAEKSALATRLSGIRKPIDIFSWRD